MCGYACKDSEPTGATADLFKDMANAVDTHDADQVSGNSMCAKMLMKTVSRRDISGKALWRCSRSFTYLSMSGSRLGTTLNGKVRLQLAAPFWINTLHDHGTSSALGIILLPKMVRFLLSVVVLPMQPGH